jgi:hypothetical protein
MGKLNKPPVTPLLRQNNLYRVSISCDSPLKQFWNILVKWGIHSPSSLYLAKVGSSRTTTLSGKVNLDLHLIEVKSGWILVVYAVRSPLAPVKIVLRTSTICSRICQALSSQKVSAWLWLRARQLSPPADPTIWRVANILEPVTWWIGCWSDSLYLNIPQLIFFAAKVFLFLFLQKYIFLF